MKANTKQVLKWLALSEGGYVNHPDDPGGATKYGVTQRVYSAWLRVNGRKAQSVRNITKKEADAIFVEQYFAPVWFDRMPNGLDYAMADYSVNSGAGRAVKDLQRVLNDLGHGLQVDGAMGNITMDAVLSEDAGLLISALCTRRMKFLRSLKHFKTFGKGWTRRVMGEEEGQQDWDSGVIDRAMRMAKNEPQRTEPKEVAGKAEEERPLPRIPKYEPQNTHPLAALFKAIFGGRK